MHIILQEDYKVLLSVFTKFEMNRRGFTEDAGSMVCNKISKIRRTWALTGTHPRRYKIADTGKKIHLEPEWMMEFRDEEGVRRFFRMKDQGPKADTNTLIFLQTKLNQEDVEEGKFLRGLQRQINKNIEWQEKQDTKRRDEENERRRRIR